MISNKELKEIPNLPMFIQQTAPKVAIMTSLPDSTDGVHMMKPLKKGKH